MSYKNFTVSFDLGLYTSLCDPESLDNLEEQVKEGVMRILLSSFPSGDCGPDQSLAEVSNIKIT